jgi:TRAP-type C4-dicarboxylate transport system permease large subunit
MAHRASASVVDVVAAAAIAGTVVTVAMRVAARPTARRRQHPDARFSHVAAAHFAKVEQETSITGHG